MTVARTIPLAFARPGSRVRVVSVSGGRGAYRRLLELGIVPGEVLKVVFNNSGPVIVERGGTRFAIGRGVAAKVMVEVVEG